MCSMLDVHAAWSASLCCGPSGSSRKRSVTRDVGGSSVQRYERLGDHGWTVLETEPGIPSQHVDGRFEHAQPYRARDDHQSGFASVRAWLAFERSGCCRSQ